MNHTISRRIAITSPTVAAASDPTVPLTWSAGSLHFTPALAPQQIVFIDGAVADASLLAAGVKPGVTAVLLNPESDELAQIAAYLASHRDSDLAAIAIVAHGSDGALRLGNAVLSASTIGRYAGDLATIGAALQPGGAIQLYGCDVAQDATGMAFLQALSAATGGASIAAASHLVGAASGGGSWTLNEDVGSMNAANPFTSSTLAAFPGELPAGPTTGELWVGTGEDSARSSANQITEVTVSDSTNSGSRDIADSSITADANLTDPVGLLVDPARGKVFDLNDSANGQQLVSLPAGGGTPTQLLATFDNGTDFPGIGGTALNEQTGTIYFTQVDVIDSSGATNSSGTGIFAVSETGGTPTQVVDGISGGVTLNNPTSIALDALDNLVFFVENDTYTSAAGGGVELEVGSLNQHNFASFALIAQLSFPQKHVDTALAIDTINHKIYFSLLNSNTGGTNFIDSVSYTLSGSLAIAGAVTTLYSGTGAEDPEALSIDPANGLLYVSGETGGVATTWVGSLNGGTPLRELFQLPGTSSDASQSAYFEATPTLTASGSVSVNQGAGSVTLDAGLTVSDESEALLASATITDTSFLTGDQLAVGNAGGLSVVNNNGTLTLTGLASVATYQAALDSVTFSSTAAGGSRTIHWSVSDGNISSALGTSTVNVLTAPSISVSGMPTFTGGSAAVDASSGVLITDASSATLASATVTIASGYIAGGDTLSVGTTGGLTAAFNNGTLTLTGNASLATYQTALDSVTFGFTPGGDPTGGGSDTSRTLDWSVNDGNLGSSVAATTLNVVHAAPTLHVSGTVTYDTGGAAIALDSGASVSDPDSNGTLTSATLSIAAGFRSGDSLNFSAQNGITGTTEAGGSILVLSGSASLADYQAALDSVTYSFSPSPGDPTGGGSDPSRTISWVVNDGVATANATSTLDVVAAPTVGAGGTVTFDGGGGPVTLDPALTVSDPSVTTLASATITIGGAITGDTLNFTNTANITGTLESGGSVLVLSGNDSLADYQSALQSVTYSFSPGDGDPTNGSRSISWVVSDGTLASVVATSKVDTVHTAPSVTAGADVLYPHNASGPVTLDPALSVSDPDSGGMLSSATVSIASGFLAGDTLDFTNTASITGSYDASTGVLTLTGTDSLADYQSFLQSVAYSFAGDASDGGTDTSRTIDWTVSDGVASSNTDTSTVETPLCFCAGTLIATPDGQVPVEQLQPGDAVITADGRAVTVRWLGRRTIALRFADGLRVLPIRIRAGALGVAQPARDLLVSPGHAVFLDGNLVNASALVNGTSVIREAAMPERFVYFHIELPEHALLLAEGLPAESFLPLAEPMPFDNLADRPEPAAEIAELPYPRIKSARQLPRATRARLGLHAAAVAA